MSPKALARTALRVYLFLLLLAVLTVANKAYSAVQLNDVIGQHCHKACVDTELFRMAIQAASEEYQVDPLIIVAIIQTESNFKPKVINRTNGRSVGLTQVQVRWHRYQFRTRVDFTDVFDNVRVGTMIYSDCLKRHHGSIQKALWCYNGHQANGMKRYVPKVMAAYRSLRDVDI